MISIKHIHKMTIAFVALAGANTVAWATADTLVPMASTKPLDADTLPSVQAGLDSLATYDAGAAAELADAVANGSLMIAEFSDQGSFSGWKGMTDADTISVRLNDGVDAGTVGVRLRHEWYHWKHGVATTNLSGGALDACGHFFNWAQTYHHLALISCEGSYSVTCQQVSNVENKMLETYFDCQAGGGTPIWPSNPPPVCCQ